MISEDEDCEIIIISDDLSELDKYFKQYMPLKQEPKAHPSSISPLKDLKELIVCRPDNYFMPSIERRIEQILQPKQVFTQLNNEPILQEKQHSQPMFPEPISQSQRSLIKPQQVSKKEEPS